MWGDTGPKYQGKVDELGGAKEQVRCVGDGDLWHANCEQKLLETPSEEWLGLVGHHGYDKRAENGFLNSDEVAGNSHQDYEGAVNAIAMIK